MPPSCKRDDRRSVGILHRKSVTVCHHRIQFLVREVIGRSVETPEQFPVGNPFGRDIFRLTEEVSQPRLLGLGGLSLFKADEQPLYVFVFRAIHSFCLSLNCFNNVFRARLSKARTVACEVPRIAAMSA